MKKKIEMIQNNMKLMFLAVILCAGIFNSAQEVSAKVDTKVHYSASTDEYFLYNASGKPMTKEGLYAIKNQKAHGHVFDGIYAVSSSGKIRTTAGISYLSEKIIQGKKYSEGYHYFDKNGRMVLTPGARKLNLTYDGKMYKGYYCFAGKDAKLICKKGLVTVGDVYYYVIDTQGKCLTGTKKKIDGFAYTFKENATGVRTSTKLTSLKTQLNSMLRSYGGTWSVYVKRLDNNDSITINNTPLYAASLIKPFVLASTYNQIEKGKIKETSTMNSLARSMITVSSNDACNELVKRQTGSHSFSTGRSIINAYLKDQTYTNTEIHHTLHPAAGGLISDGGRNCTSVKDCGRLLESVYRGTCVNSKNSKKMLNFLLAQQRRWKIPAGLPSGTKVANKTGETSSSDHDIAIVYSPKCTYILCVMSQNAPSSSGRISQISKRVYKYFN